MMVRLVNKHPIDKFQDEMFVEHEVFGSFLDGVQIMNQFEI